MRFTSANFLVHGDEYGYLVAIEEGKEVPFPIKRAYYLYNIQEGITRGHNAYRTTRQLVVCVSGSCLFKLNDGQTTTEIYLDSPNSGLILEALVWCELSDFSSDCVLLVLASEPYDESDHIRNYDEFLGAL